MLQSIRASAGFLLDARVRILDANATPLADSGLVEWDEALVWTSPDGLTRVERSETYSLEQTSPWIQTLSLTRPRQVYRLCVLPFAGMRGPGAITLESNPYPNCESTSIVWSASFSVR